jgi:hypothetical protein
VYIQPLHSSIAGSSHHCFALDQLLIATTGLVDKNISHWLLKEQRQHLRLRIRVLAACPPVDLLLPSPPRQAGRDAEDEEGKARSSKQK